MFRRVILSALFLTGIFMLAVLAARLTLGQMPVSFIAFNDERGQGSAVYLLDTGRRMPVSVTPRSVTSVRNLIWSDDGQLAFVGFSDNGSNIYVLSFNLSPDDHLTDTLQITAISLMAATLTPSWYADNRIAYVAAAIASNDRVLDIHVWDMNASPNETRITGTEADEVSPTWLSDHELVYTQVGEPYQLMYLNLTTGENFNINNNELMNHGPVAFEPLRLVAFGSHRHPRSYPTAINIWNVAENTIWYIPQPRGNSEDAVWSHDGLLAFANYSRSFGSDIYVWDSATNTTTNMTQTAARDSSPSWSSDGGIAYWSDRNNTPGIYLLDTAGNVELIYAADEPLFPELVIWPGG